MRARTAPREERGRAGEGVLEELADDEGLVESAAFVFDSGDEALRVNGCETLYDQ